jgi:Carboxypeptidase regulatory-like domain
MKNFLLILVVCATTVVAQRSTGSLKGLVSDEFGGVIVGATVTATDAGGTAKTATTNGDGAFVLAGLPPGKYSVQITAPGFATFENGDLEILSGAAQKLDAQLKVTIEQQKVTVAVDGNGVNTDPENNVGAIVMKGADLESLPDDPDDLAAALQALAGPSAGPNGGQIYVDGFSGGRLPSLASIREIRINSNPYSAEYDRPGFGRIEILTKPGTDRFRGQVNFNFNNQELNSRNPFSLARPPYLSRQYGANISGPISKRKASFFLEFEKRDINDQAVVNATILDPSLNIISFSESVLQPNRRWDFSPRLDYQINKNNTLVARYEYERVRNLTGAGGFSLGSRRYRTFNTQQSFRLTETSILNKRTVNETRFQFTHQSAGDMANNSIPTINVQEAFVGGGSQVGLSSNQQNRWELTNTTSLALGTHSIKFGARLRNAHLTSNAPQNFGGTWTFAGSRRPSNPDGFTSIEVYQITLQGLQAGLTPTQIRLAGGGATQFTIASGNPRATVSQFDFGGFLQDDWRLRPNLTLDLGLRYENQSNINSNVNLAPRVGFAWAPGTAGQQAKTTIRGGFGFFYDRVNENLTLTANRLNGINQQQYIVTDPAVLNSFPVVPSIETLNAFATPVSIYQLANDLQAPYTMQAALSLERALPHNLTTSVTFSHSRTLHLLRAHAINAPLPGTFIPGVPGSGVRPLGGINNYFQYESTGDFDQNQLIVTLGGRFSRSLNFNINYAFSKSKSDSDGSGTFAANPYDFTYEYGAASNDVRHRFSLNGSYRAPWGISINPFLIITSGTPFNITIGRDLNGDTLFTERPAFATDLTTPGVVVTPFGAFDPNPAPGAVIIPRNYGRGPGAITSLLRLSKTFGFGRERTSTVQSERQRPGAGGGPRGGFGGLGRGAQRGGGGGARGGGGFGGGDAGKRYNLTFSVSFQNILNHVNYGRPIGNLSSSLFGLSNSSAGGFGGFGGRGGGSAPYNRLIEMQVRFSF